jgi:hypothetical protein
MDLDTCAEVSVASSILYEQLGKPTLAPAPLLRAYGGSEIPTLGQCDVEVEFRNQRKSVSLIFAKSDTAKCLFGRPWIEQFNVLSLNTLVNSSNSKEQYSAILDEYANDPATASWQRIRVDHAGPFLGYYWFLLVDAFSKFAGVHRVKHIDSTTTINVLREIFGLFGLPNQVVSDNGPAFISEEFQEFLKRNKIQHNRSAPCHPQTNGEVERFVQTFKRSMKASVIKGTEAEVDRCLQQFLLKYRVTPHGTTGRCPAELFLGRRPNTLLDRLRPDLKKDIIHREEVQHRKRAEVGKLPDFNLGDKVYCRFWYGTRRWRKGIIVAIAGPLSYDVQVGDEVHRRHAAQLFHDRGIEDPEEQERLNRVLDIPSTHQQPEKPQQLVVPPIEHQPQPDARVPQLPNLENLPAPVEVVPPVPRQQKQETSAIPLTTQTSAKPPTEKKAPPPQRAPSTRVSKKPIRFDEEFSKLGSHK